MLMEFRFTNFMLFKDDLMLNQLYIFLIGLKQANCLINFKLIYFIEI